MRIDQFEKLQRLHEQLIDAALGEADPAKWPGNGIEPAAMDQQTRGDRYWCKKNAVATFSLAMRVDSLIGRGLGVPNAPSAAAPSADDGDEAASRQLDAEVKAAEKEAARMLAKVQRKAKDAAQR